MLSDKNIVVCVCGGIAIYKVVDVVSRLKKLNAFVTVVMTESATKFVTPLTFQAISQNKVYDNLFDENNGPDIKHITVGQNADLIVVAPATANIIGKLSNGIADEMVTTTIIASNAPKLLVPAMNTNMYENSIVQENLRKLNDYGYNYMIPESGSMAMKEEGKGIGRLPDPEKIIDQILNVFESQE